MAAFISFVNSLLGVVCNKHRTKSARIRSFSGRYFPAFWLNTRDIELNTDRYSVSLRIQSKMWKNTDQKNSEYGHFLLSEMIYILFFSA